MPAPSKLTEAQAREAGERLIDGEPLQKLAHEYGISTVRLSVHVGRQGYRIGWHYRGVPERRA